MKTSMPKEKFTAFEWMLWGGAGKKFSAFACVLWGCAALVFVYLVLVMVQAASLDRGLYSSIGTIQFQHGYSITLEEDWDILVIYGTLHGSNADIYGPNANVDHEPSDVHRFRLAVLTHGNQAPHLIVNQATDGSVAWVISEKHPDQVLFLIDYRNGDYWNCDTRRMSDDTGAKYLKQINADGVKRSFDFGGAGD